MSDYHLTPINEIWKAIPGFEGYDVSDQGRVRSYWRRAGLGKGNGSTSILEGQPQKIFKANPNSDGYPTVGLSKNGEIHTCLVHHLVLETFIGPCPPGFQACHWDGIRINNFLENLRWDTSSNNHSDQKRHGTMPIVKGTANPQSKLTEDQVFEIRSLYAQGFLQTNIAKIFGVHKGTVNDIVLHKTWTHI